MHVPGHGSVKQLQQCILYCPVISWLADCSPVVDVLQIVTQCMACHRECQQQPLANPAASWPICKHYLQLHWEQKYCFCSDVTDEQPPSAASVAVLLMNHHLMHCPWCRRHARTSGTPKRICLSVSRSSMQQCTLVTRNSNSTTPASWSTGKRKLWTRSCALTRRFSPRSKLKCYSLFVYTYIHIPCININASLDILQTINSVVSSFFVC